MQDKYNDDLKFIAFAEISRVANMLQNVMDLGMKEITSKQWLPLIMIVQFPYAPTLNELAEKCGITRQSTKQLIDKLVEREFVCISRDEYDKRNLRISLTKKGRDWAEVNFSRNKKFVENLFDDVTEEELNNFNKTQKKLLNQLQHIKYEFNLKNGSEE